MHAVRHLFVILASMRSTKSTQIFLFVKNYHMYEDLYSCTFVLVTQLDSTKVLKMITELRLQKKPRKLL